jgi:S1-C subfamily serine protease
MATSNPLVSWPELYGFYIYGSGPTYVVYVEPDSISATAGIRVGDRIIEIDSRDVTNLSAEAIKLIARNGKNNPPAISVQSYSKEVELVPNLSIVKSTGANPFGMNVRGDMPTLVEYVHEGGPAHVAGIRAGNAAINHSTVLHDYFDWALFFNLFLLL